MRERRDKPVSEALWLAVKLGLVCLVSIIACNQGLTPPEEVTKPLPKFPIEPQGGDPTGTWIPHPDSALKVTVLNPEKLEGFGVDSLRIFTILKGSYVITGDRAEINSTMTLVPFVWVSGQRQPIRISPISDTLRTTGAYRMLQGKVLVFDFRTRLFQLDTLGFTQQEGHLQLISMPNTFPASVLPYPGINEIEFYFRFNLIRSTSVKPLALRGRHSAIGLQGRAPLVPLGG